LITKTSLQEDRLFVKTKAKKAEKKKESLSESIAGIAAVLVSGLFIITFIIQAFEIPSESMVQTAAGGRHVFCGPALTHGQGRLCWPICSVPRNPAWRHYCFSPSERAWYVRGERIIGIPGDRIHLRDGKVYRNGEAPQ